MKRVLLGLALLAASAIDAAPLSPEWSARVAADDALWQRDWTRSEFVEDGTWQKIDVRKPVEAWRAREQGLVQFRSEVELEAGTAYKLRLGAIPTEYAFYFNGVRLGGWADAKPHFEHHAEFRLPARLIRRGKNLLAIEGAIRHTEYPTLRNAAIELTPWRADETALDIRPTVRDSFLFFPDEKPSFTLDLFGEVKPGAELVWRVTDAHGGEVLSGKVPAAASTTLNLPRSLPNGFYSLAVNNATCPFGVIFDLGKARVANVRSRFGVNAGSRIGLGASWFEKMAWERLAGVAWHRSGIFWDRCEPERGRFDWSALDAQVKRAEETGLSFYPIFEETMPFWATEANAKRTGKQDGWARRTLPPDSVADWAGFVRAVATRYRGRITVYQLGNEPNHRHFWQADFANGGTDHYGEMLCAAARVIREADPDAVIVAPGLSLTDVTYLRAMGRRGVLDLVDGVSYHPYRTNGSPEGESQWLFYYDTPAGRGNPAHHIRELHRAVSEFCPGKKKFIDATEFCWLNESRNMRTVTPLTQADYLVRFHLLGFSSHKRMMWYEFANGADGLQGWSLIGNDGVPRPAFVAFNAMARFFGGATPVRDDFYDAGFYLTRATMKDGAPVAAAWTSLATNALPMMVRAASDVEVFDVFGRKTRTIAAGRAEMLELTGSPIYLTGDFGSAKLISRVDRGDIRCAPGDTVEIALSLANPTERPLAGEFICTGFWKFDVQIPPDCRQVALQPGEKKTVRLRLSIAKDAPVTRKVLMPEWNADGRRIVAEVPFISELPDTGSAAAAPIADWLVAGPFPAPKLLFSDLPDEANWRPQEGDVTAGRTWRRYKPPHYGVDVDTAGKIDFFGIGMTGARINAYAFTWVWSPEERPAILRMGSDDGNRVYLNGERVWNNPHAVRTVMADEDGAPVVLKAGWNALLMKVTNRGEAFGFVARFTDSHGHSMPDLRFSLAK